MSAWLQQRREGGLDSMTRSTIVLGYDSATYQSDMSRNFTAKQSEYSTKEAVDKLKQQKTGALHALQARRAHCEHSPALSCLLCWGARAALAAIQSSLASCAPRTSRWAPTTWITPLPRA